jgi:hypothetical protein
MSTDYRALCAELLQLEQEQPVEYTDWKRRYNAAIARVRAALAQPEPVAPTNEDLEDLAEVMNVSGNPVPAMRRALELWGTPTIQPVPVSERLPGAEDCDAEGRCWIFMPDIGTDPSWRLTDPRDIGPYHTHSLPANALPTPEAANV